MHVLVFVLILAVIYGAFHHHHYRRRRRAGFGVWDSMRGPFGTRVTISKRF
jgi:hypothetical protein